MENFDQSAAPTPPPWAHLVPNNIPGTPPSGPAKLRSAANAVKHGLYSREFVFMTAADQGLYETLLHGLREEYQPITVTECGLVQQLAEVQFRYLKTQKLHAAALRAETLKQSRQAGPDPLGNAPSEIDLEARAYLALLDNSPGFRLFLRELERLPNRIHKVIARIHLNLKLRGDIAGWTHKPYPNQPSADPEPFEIPAPMEIEQKEKTQETSAPPSKSRGPGKENWPPVLADRFEFYKLWDEKLEPHNHEIILNGDPEDYRRKAFFDCCGHDLAQMKAWLAQREFERKTEKEQLPPPR
jgi:hypothetical protein